jgi:hypothetical protein
LIVVLARELLANAAKHSGASRVVVTVAADFERIDLEVRDDGVGFAAGRPSAALLDGHIDLASTEQWTRARAAGGELVVSSARAGYHGARHAAARRHVRSGALSNRMTAQTTAVSSGAVHRLRPADRSAGRSRRGIAEATMPACHGHSPLHSARHRHTQPGISPWRPAG